VQTRLKLNLPYYIVKEAVEKLPLFFLKKSAINKITMAQNQHIRINEKEALFDLKLLSLNSLSASVISFLSLWFFQLLIVMINSSVFNYKGHFDLAYFYYSNASGKYEWDRVLFIYGLGPFFSILFAILFSKLSSGKVFRQHRLLLTWLLFYSFFMSFGFVGASLMARRFIGTVLFFINLPPGIIGWVCYVIGSPFIIIFLLICRSLVPIFLRTSSHNTLLSDYIKEFFLAVVLLPGLGSLVIFGLVFLGSFQIFHGIVLIALLGSFLVLNSYGNSRFDFRSVKDERASINYTYLTTAIALIALALLINFTGIYWFA